jgi:ferredoxin
VLCTTCNDCTNLNPRLFRYNENKQATIADATAGTFEDLVRAAEKCPARCIHPGKPRADDPTGTDELIARAAPFN